MVCPRSQRVSSRDCPGPEGPWLFVHPSFVEAPPICTLLFCGFLVQVYRLLLDWRLPWDSRLWVWICIRVYTSRPPQPAHFLLRDSVQWGWAGSTDLLVRTSLQVMLVRRASFGHETHRALPHSSCGFMTGILSVKLFLGIAFCNLLSHFVISSIYAW